MSTPSASTQVAAFLAIQHRDAQLWRDASIAYFQSLSGLPLPAGYAAPEHTLDYYESLTFPYAPGNPGMTAAPFVNSAKATHLDMAPKATPTDAH